MDDVDTITFACQYCGHAFKKEHTLTVHMCEQKRRFNERSEKGVALGLHAYNKFYQHSMDRNKVISFSEFAKTSYYKAFVKFGRYIIKTKCISTERFIHFVIVTGIKLDDWAKDTTYTRFLDEFVQNEPVSDALTRSIECSIEWGTKKDMESQDMLRFGNDSTLCYYVTTGKISPWVLYQSDSGMNFLGRISSEQVEMIFHLIDPELWNKIFASNYEDVEFAKDMLGQAGW